MPLQTSSSIFEPCFKLDCTQAEKHYQGSSFNSDSQNLYQNDIWSYGQKIRIDGSEHSDVCSIWVHITLAISVSSTRDRCEYCNSHHNITTARIFISTYKASKPYLHSAVFALTLRFQGCMKPEATRIARTFLTHKTVQCFDWFLCQSELRAQFMLVSTATLPRLLFLLICPMAPLNRNGPRKLKHSTITATQKATNKRFFKPTSRPQVCVGQDTAHLTWTSLTDETVPFFGRIVC